MLFYLYIQLLIYIDEIRHEHHYFKTISEHKECQRVTNSFAGGLTLLQPYVDKLMTVSENVQYISMGHCFDIVFPHKFYRPHTAINAIFGPMTRTNSSRHSPQPNP